MKLSERLVEETEFSFSQEVPIPGERRKTERHLKILRVGTLVRDGVRELCMIRNISAGGLMAHAYSDLPVGHAVAVELKSNQQLTGTVAWVRSSNVGIAFDAPIDVAELLSNPPVLANGWKPRLPRVQIDRLATLRSGARTFWVTALDISQGGAKLESGEPIEIGSEAVLSFESFRPIPGVVRWQGGGLCGIGFNQLLPFGELVEWLKRAD